MQQVGALENWARAAVPWFESQGATSKAALAFARLYAYSWAAGLQPRVTSIFRDPAHQKELQRRWDAGNRAGLRARPADASKHTETGWFGRPAAKAMDMPTRDDRRAAEIARFVGLGTGESFTQPDAGHYYIA